MKLAFHGATTMTSNLETDVAVSAHAGFKALEVWAAKIDAYLATHSLTDLISLFIDSMRYAYHPQFNRVHCISRE